MELDRQSLPLTRGQLDIWLSQETAHSGTDWQLGVSVRIEGTVERDALERAIHHVVREAEPLRAAFFEVDGQVFQRAIDYSAVNLAFHDLSSSRHPAQEARAIASSIRRTPMPLGGPLFKFALFQTRLDEFYLFVCCHHIVADGIGLALVCHRIAAVYSAIVSDTPIPAAFFGSLQDLVDCELEYERSSDYLEDEAYWVRNLPAENSSYRRAPRAANECDRDSSDMLVQLDPLVVSQIEELCKTLNVFRSSLITAACALLLHGCGLEGSEVALDFPVSRRVRPELKTLPGMISGVVPLVLKVSPELPIADFCVHVDTRIREALRHQRFPVRAIEHNSGFRRSEQPSNRVVVNHIPTARLGDFGGSPAWGTMTHSGLGDQFGLFFFRADDQLFLSISGAGHLSPNDSVYDLAQRLERVLVAMAADPQRRLSSVDVLAADEHDLLDEWGNRAVLSQSVAPVSVPELFDAQAARTPDAVALTFEDRSWTYRELDEAANRLAHALIERGVGAGQCVALLFPRCAEAIVAMLAVLKSGAAYLPIDPALPGARVQFMVADAAPAAVITTADLADRVDGYDLAVIDADDPAVAMQPRVAPPGPAPSDVAHLIYTSGTTGVPKGVAVTQHNVAQLFDDLWINIDLSGEQVWTQFHSYAFDFSVWEIWGALLHGGRLVVVPDSAARSPEEFHDLLVGEGVTVLTQTPSAVGMLATEGLDGTALVVGAEPCPPEVVDRWAPGRVMINVYGPTETTMWACKSPPLTAGSGFPPIGSPVRWAAFFVLDGWLRPVPAGVVGELYVAGAGVG
ncbi:non-ribosomal peptide synthetase, partial [Mycobacterium arosiense]|uniref:non-ribosomal peptide synthetase n=1 Tax=Mycobacterium arosiense TaxID=425468 RepID=UPI0011512567